jgi:hypothetical protein
MEEVEKVSKELKRSATL